MLLALSLSSALRAQTPDSSLLTVERVFGSGGFAPEPLGDVRSHCDAGEGARDLPLCRSARTLDRSPHQEAAVPTYLWRGSYTTEGVKGLVKDGGSKRRSTVQQMVEKAGGKLHAFYFALGEADVFGIAEFPDTATAVAVSTTVNASGSVKLSSTLLITPEEFDAAARQTIAYRPPGA